MAKDPVRVLVTGAAGHGGSHNPKAVHTTLLSKQQKLQEELQSVEKQVYELETSYLQETSNFGNAIKGFEGFLSSSKGSSILKRSRKFQLEDRVFSLSSATSPATRELGAGPEGLFNAGYTDGRLDLGQVRPKGTGAITEPAKPKKERPDPRDGKKLRLSNDIDNEAKEDPDMSLR